MSHTIIPKSGSRNETRFRKMLPSDLVAFQQLKLICHFYFEAILARTDRKKRINMDESLVQSNE